MTNSVSVVIPSRNERPTLARAIRSVSSQIPQPLEIIVVDNASTDGTGEMLARETFGSTPLRVIRRDVDQGPAYSLRTGFEAAQGDWIAYCDADDRWLPGRLQSLLQFAESHDVVADNLLLIKQGEVPRAAFISGGPVDLIRFLNATRCPGRATAIDMGYIKPMVRREWVQRLPFPPERYGPDWCWIVQLLNAGARMWLTDTPTYEYTIRQGSVSRTRTPDRARVLQEVAERAYELCSDPAAKRLLQERIDWFQPSVDLSTFQHDGSLHARLAALGRLAVNSTAWRRYGALGLRKTHKWLHASEGRQQEGVM